MWSEDGFVLRFPESGRSAGDGALLMEPEEAAELVMRQLGSTALFAAKFREARRGRCCCRGAGRMAGRRCGSSGSGRMTC